MRIFLILAFLISFTPAAWAQVVADPDNVEVDGPARYRLDPNYTDPNAAQVGRPYPYYYGGAYGYPYYGGYYRPGVQAVPDANDPNYFPPDAALGAKPPPAPAKKAAPQSTPY